MPDKMDTRLPYSEGQKDFMAFLRFLDSRKVYDGYMNGLDEKITKFLAAAKLYGKIAEIEKKHAEAELWAERAEHDYAEREGKLVAGEKSLAKDDKETRAVLLDIEQRAETVRRKLDGELRAREAAVKVREDEVGHLEQMAAEVMTVAQAKALGAVEAKRVADAMVQRMKVAVVPANG